MAIKKIVKSRVEKIRNHFTLSEAGFWSFIRSTLRNASRWWKPITQAKLAARRAYRGTKKLQKWEYQCAHCKDWFMEKEIAADHVIEVGSLTCKQDVGDFIERLFVEMDGIQILCNKRNDGVESCHTKKTQAYMKNQRENKK